MHIQKLTPSDYDNVIALWTACPEMELNDVDDSREGFERFLDRNPDTCFAAVEGEQLQGVILSGNDGRRGYIYHAAVAPDARGRGIGSELVQAVLEQMKAFGISKVGLLVFADNENGARFWKSHGFDVRSDLLYCSNVLVPVRRIGKA